MADNNVGSIVNEVHNLIENIPVALSGTNMDNTVNRQIFHIENYTGQNVDSTAIADKFVPAVVDFTASEVLGAMEMLGVDAAEIKLGDFTVKKGSMSNTSAARQFFGRRAFNAMKYLGREVRYFKANG